MKRLLLLVALTSVIVGCSPPSAPERPQPNNPAPSAPPYTVPASSTVIPANLTTDPLLPPGWVVSPVTFGGPMWIEVTAIPAARSPGDGASCTGVASEGEQHRLYIRAANCGSTGTATLTFTLAGQTTPEVIGDQDLMLVQKIAGKVVRVTAVVKVGNVQVWPR
ncbi:hypothetical protein DKM44_02410 [Deinococcus irradiatisoli]|uniref:Uncharacterized protein n=1 Tax=Deinococcus irradiatisoli TaxID=2202254 RepID=A0A2Z3JH09_9DEIO|nr:hypothetical protein [Deinococcus irradiatisoli]AWN22229.1 hypothetical protein DKM44_02410 [Deinococcus irradiatisoli]